MTPFKRLLVVAVTAATLAASIAAGAIPATAHGGGGRGGAHAGQSTHGGHRGWSHRRFGYRGDAYDSASPCTVWFGRTYCNY